MFLEANSFYDIWRENFFENIFITLNFNLTRRLMNNWLTLNIVFYTAWVVPLCQNIINLPLRLKMATPFFLMFSLIILCSSHARPIITASFINFFNEFTGFHPYRTFICTLTTHCTEVKP